MVLHNVYAIMLVGPLKIKKVFAGSDYLTASASRRYFNLGGILVHEKWTKLLKPWRTCHGYFFGIGSSSYGIYSPCLTHSYTLQYLHINISTTVYRISFDKYIYVSYTWRQNNKTENSFEQFVLFKIQKTIDPSGNINI